MASTVASFFSTNSSKIREVLNPSIEKLMPEVEPIFEQLVSSNQGVMGNDGLGRDMKIIRIYQGGLTGTIEPGGYTNDMALYGDALNSAAPGSAGSLGQKLYLQGQSFSGSANMWPDPFTSPNQRPFRLAVPMRSMLGNLPLTLGEMSAEATPAVIGDIIGPKLSGFALNWAMTISLYWYLSQNSLYQLCSATDWTKYTDSTGASSTAGSILRFSPSNYATHRFAVGMRVQIYDPTGATVKTSVTGGSISTFIVTRVDPIVNYVEVMCPDGSVFTLGAADTPGNTGSSNTVGTTATGTADIVVLANSKGTSSTPNTASPYFTGIAGINSWLKTGDDSFTDGNYNCLLGSEKDSTDYISVTRHPEFRSLGVDMAGAPLTEHKLRQILMRWDAAKMPLGKSIDTLWGSEGVWLAYEAQKIGRERIDRTGKLSSLQNEGTSGKGMEFTFNGRTIKGYISNRIEAGAIYGHKFAGGNWKRITPPSPSGTKRMANTPAFAPVEYVAPALTGTSSTIMPVYKNSSNQTRVTEFVQMPVMCRMQIMPWDQPDGIKIVRAAEDRTWGSSTTTNF